jgi:hypothetical protein
MRNKHGLTAPFDNDLLTQLDLADIHLYRRTSRLGSGAGEPSPHEGDCGPYCSGGTNHTRGGHQEATPAIIHAVITHPVVSHQLISGPFQKAF